MVSIFVEKKNEETTLALSKTLEELDLPADVNLTINNIEKAESGILRKDGKVVDISLANCYTLEDVVQALVSLLVSESQ